MTKGAKSQELRNANDKDSDDQKKQEEKIRIMNEKFQRIDKEIAETGEMDVNDAIKAMYLAFFGTDSLYNVKEMREKITEFEDRFDEQEEKIASLEKKVVDLEIDRFKNRVTLKNIPLANPEEKKETYLETKATIEEIFNLTDQNLSSVADFFRFYPKNTTKTRGKEKNEKKMVPKILLEFISSHELKKFTSKLLEVRKNKKFKSIIMENDCPPSLLKDYNAANKEAYRLRTSKGFSTKTVITKQGIKLKVKAKNDKFFVEVKFPIE